MGSLTKILMVLIITYFQYHELSGQLVLDMSSCVELPENQSLKYSEGFTEEQLFLYHVVTMCKSTFYKRLLNSLIQSKKTDFAPSYRGKLRKYADNSVDYLKQNPIEFFELLKADWGYDTIESCQVLAKLENFLLLNIQNENFLCNLVISAKGKSLRIWLYSTYHNQPLPRVIQQKPAEIDSSSH